MENPENRLWKLLALKFSGEATSDELLELQECLEANPPEQNIINSIEEYWNQKDDLLDKVDEMEEYRFHLIVNPESQNEQIPVIEPAIKKINKYKWLIAAASVLIISVTGILIKVISDNNSSGNAGMQHVYVKPGSRSKMILPDGTIVRLNGSSTLTYNKDFNKKVREVYLNGEGFFDVTKDANHPFVVHTSNIDIKVLGTLFNVKSYEEDETVEATLLRGSIEVYTKNDPSAPTVILKPNEKLIFRKKKEIKPLNQTQITTDSANNSVDNEGISISALPANQPDSLKEETSWLYNRLVIDGDDFIKMAEKMERWYGIKIQILSPELVNYHFKGIFKNETIEQALDALQLTAKFQYIINNDTIKISK